MWGDDLRLRWRVFEPASAAQITRTHAWLDAIERSSDEAHLDAPHDMQRVMPPETCARMREVLARLLARRNARPWWGPAIVSTLAGSRDATPSTWRAALAHESTAAMAASGLGWLAEHDEPGALETLLGATHAPTELARIHASVALAFVCVARSARPSPAVRAVFDALAEDVVFGVRLHARAAMRRVGLPVPLEGGVHVFVGDDGAEIAIGGGESVLALAHALVPDPTHWTLYHADDDVESPIAAVHTSLAHAPRVGEIGLRPGDEIVCDAYEDVVASTLREIKAG